ncbi:MAG TPA: molybdate ABC transporter permease subunit [Solirubrobacterales bacterium]|nr:molybdate ABC transporter permease subunit [Solirubrobacterales bacterium]
MRLRSGFGLLALAAAALAVAFLVLPVVAIFADVSPGRLLDALGEESAREALWLSLRTTVIAMVLVVAVGAPAAYLLALKRFRGRSLVLAAIELPLVLPPAVAGIALLAALGPDGILGGALAGAGLELVFQTAGVVVALVFVSAPFFLRQAIAAFAALDPRLLEAARTLGAGPFRAFATVAVPSARPGLAAGLALAWGRALGEFGATLLFAGSLEGVTQTAPLAIFSAFNRPGGFTSALALSAVLIVLAATILVGVKLLGADRAVEAPPQVR